MLLKNLIKKTEGYKHRVKNLNIKNLSLDSRKVKRGDLFFALRGSNNDGNNFINHAITKGAAAIICSKKKFVGFFSGILNFLFFFSQKKLRLTKN